MLLARRAAPFDESQDARSPAGQKPATRHEERPVPRKGRHVARDNRHAKPTVTIGDEDDLAELLADVETPFLLVLDSIQDPHNLGACMRTADAAGVHGIVVPRKGAASMTDTVARVACGAAERVPFIQVQNLANALESIRDAGVWVVGTGDDADGDIYATKLTGKLAFVMGAEEKGIRPLIRKHCDELVRIPMAGTAESLNVSVATGICLFESVRQRRVAAS